MRYRWVRLCQWLLGVLGISASISSCGGRLTPVEYGQPNMDYSVKGKVVDSKSGAGVPGIEVSHIPYGEQVDTTGLDGSFEITGSTFPEDELSVRLKDVYPEQDGKYKDTEASVRLQQKKEGSGHWYRGAFEATDVVLKIEQEEAR